MASDSPIELDPAQHRRLAAQWFNETWALLEKKPRTPSEDALMLHKAHASRMHWQSAGTPQNWLVGEWQIARAYCELKMADPAQLHARLALVLAEQNGITGFFLGSAHEGMARALNLTDPAAARGHLQKAREILATLTDAEDVEVLKNDLETCGVA